jgi:capsular polysaccharide biosynthesis protein
MNSNIQAGSQFVITYVGLVDSAGLAVDTAAHLHMTNTTTGEQTVVTTANAEITYAAPATDPLTGAAVVNKYEAIVSHSVPGNYRAHFHFPDIQFVANPQRYSVSGPAITEPT